MDFKGISNDDLVKMVLELGERVSRLESQQAVFGPVRISVEPVELDEEAKRALYENRHELYE